MKIKKKRASRSVIKLIDGPVISLLSIFFIITWLYTPVFTSSKYVLNVVSYNITVNSAETFSVTSIGAISGTAQVGQTLTAGALTPTGATAFYQWQRSAAAEGIYSNIFGATLNTYTLAEEDYNCYIRVAATGTGSYTGTAASASTGPVAAAPLTSIGAINGAAQVGQTLTAGALTPTGATAFYQWQKSAAADGIYSNISGATSNTYLLAEGDYNYYFRVAATGTGSYTGTATSASTGPVTSSPLIAIGAIGGIDIVGQTLTAGALTPAGATATYQWQRSTTANGTYADISGAASNTYSLVPGDYNYFIRLVANGTGSYSGTVTSPYKGPVGAKTISTAAITGISYPITGNTAATTLPDTIEYTAAAAWSPTPPGGLFEGNTVYTATITISPKSGYTLTGVPENFFTVSGATSVTNPADSGVVTAVFPSTALAPITAIAAINGTAQVGQTLTAGALTPSGATATYQWQRSAVADGTYTSISGATSNAYTLTAGDYNYYIKVVATGTGSYSGTATSAYKGPVQPMPISISAVIGVTFPVTDAPAATTITATSEYTGSISWSPALVDGKFQGNNVYTATITLTPKSGYTLTGVPENFFTVSGATSVTNPVDSGVVTAVFPSTTLTPITAVSGIGSIAIVGETLTAGALTPAGATATYQWQRSTTANGTYADISGAASNTYSLVPGDYNYFIRLVATGTGSYSGTVTSPYKGPVGAKTIGTAAITGISYPITGNTAATTLPDTIEYTAAVAWSPTPPGGLFEGNTIYTATITISPKSGYTLTGVPENFFTVSGATSVTNPGDSGVVTVVFPSTALAPITAISAINGTEQVGQTLTVGTLTPSGATATYQWQRSAAAGGTYTSISGATSNAYTLTAGDYNYYIKVVATGTDSYSGTATSAYKGPVQPMPISTPAISGIDFPVAEYTAATTVTATSEYTGSISWSPALASGKFQGGVAYTATITLTPKSGYTSTGVPANFFTVSGAASVTNAADSGAVTAAFATTAVTPITNIAATGGIAMVGQTLTAGALTPAGATVTYRWQRSTTANGTFADISGATSSTYTLVSGDYNYFIRLVATGTGSYSGTVTSPYKGPIGAKTISTAAITGISYPITGNAAATTLPDTIEYTAAVLWSPTPPGGIFGANTVYTATITLTPKSGYTTTGIPENFFTVAGATSVTNSADSGAVAVVYPSTACTPITGIAGITGASQVGQILTVGTITPAGATAAYQWEKSAIAGGTYTSISGATANTYTLTLDDLNQFIRVKAVGTGDYSGEATSPYKGPVELSHITIPAINGITVPVKDAAAVTTITETSEYTGAISWSPALSGGKFLGFTEYTATITITPKSGYTLTGVPANFFTVAGATSVTNAKDSGVVTAVFPATDCIPITAIAGAIGSERIGYTLTAGALTPAGATATYQWQRSAAAYGTYVNIAGATANTYTVTAGDYNYYLRVVATGTGSYSGVLTSPYKGPVEPSKVSIPAISGVTYPVTGNTAAMTLPDTSEYTAAISWSPALVDGKFQGNTVYTATITITPKSGYTLTGITANFFTVAGATSVTNSAGSGVVTAVFPSTALTPITAIAGITGVERVGRTLTAGALTPAGATVTYQWQRSTTADGTYTNISGATASTYTILAGSYNYYLRVVATGTGSYSGVVTSPYKGPIASAPISKPAILGILVPVKDTTAATTVQDTNEYTAIISWSPALSGGKFQGNTVYTATITINPKSGYTLTGVPENFFTVSGAASVTNSADSGVVTAVFPSTAYTPVTAVGAISGMARVGQTLTAGALTPAEATAAYQWQRSTSADGTYTNISGAASANYTLTAGDYGYYIRVVATGTGDYAGSPYSEYLGLIAAAPISISAVSGVNFPVYGETAVTTLPDTSEYTAEISWSPAPSGGIFEGNTVYTAAITLSPKPSYAVTSVPANFFTVSGATSVTNSADSGVITAVFPCTGLTPVTSIEGIGGINQVGHVLTAGVLSPAGATATYQWKRNATSDGTYTSIAGATSNTYTLTASDFGYYFRVEATGTGDYSGAATSPYKGPIEPATVSMPAIEGVSFPITDNPAATTITATSEYTGTVSWNPSLSDGKFKGNTVYTAIITITPKTGYKTAGVPANFFTVSGAMSVTNSADSGVVTAVFPNTALTPITAIEAINGTAQVGQTLTAGALTPSGATTAYQWQRSTAWNGTYASIVGATSASYAPVAGDYNYYLRVVATGTGDYSGVATSTYKGPIAPAPISISAIEGVSIPVFGENASTTITDTSQFTGSISWSPDLAGGKFKNKTVYTATITLTPKSGYTLTGVPANFFTVFGATTVTNPVNSGIVTALFPETRMVDITDIAGISGTARVGQTLTAGELMPAGAVATYQWQRSMSADGTYDNIAGATTVTYTLTADDYNCYVKVMATGSDVDGYSGTVVSPYKGPVEAAQISISAISGIFIPATGETAVATLPDTSEYMAAISWSPTMPEGTFLADTIYTATVTITPKSGYTLTGVPEDFFTVAGMSFITNPAGSGNVTVEFPSTE